MISIFCCQCLASAWPVTSAQFSASLFVALETVKGCIINAICSGFITVVAMVIEPLGPSHFLISRILSISEKNSFYVSIFRQNLTQLKDFREIDRNHLKICLKCFKIIDASYITVVNLIFISTENFIPSRFQNCKSLL